MLMATFPYHARLVSSFILCQHMHSHACRCLLGGYLPTFMHAYASTIDYVYRLTVDLTSYTIACITLFLIIIKYEVQTLRPGKV